VTSEPAGQELPRIDRGMIEEGGKGHQVVGAARFVMRKLPLEINEFPVDASIAANSLWLIVAA